MRIQYEQAIYEAMRNNPQIIALVSDSGTGKYKDIMSELPSRYIEFVNRDENVDFDTKMKTLQSELKELLTAEEKSKEDLLSVFKELGYEIKL